MKPAYGTQTQYLTCSGKTNTDSSSVAIQTAFSQDMLELKTYAIVEKQYICIASTFAQQGIGNFEITSLFELFPRGPSECG